MSREKAKDILTRSINDIDAGTPSRIIVSFLKIAIDSLEPPEDR